MEYEAFSILLNPVLVIDRAGSVVYANEACEPTFGISAKSLLRKQFPDFIGLKEPLGMSLDEIKDTTLYRGSDFDTGRRAGSVLYAIQPVRGPRGEDQLMVSFFDDTAEKSLSIKYNNERMTGESLAKDVLSHRADLMLMQDRFERKVTQMSFLLKFYSQTRFLLDIEAIAQKFLHLACEELGFLHGIYFSYIPGSGLFRFGGRFFQTEFAEPLNETMILHELPPADGLFFQLREPVSVFDNLELTSLQAPDFYRQYGIADVINAAIVTFQSGDRPLGQFHLLNFAHTSEIDTHTIELLGYVVNPLQLTFENAELYRTSVTDDLTQLYNVRYFRMRLQSELARAKRDQEPLALAMIDLDHFKKVNDTYGHPVGDLALRLTSRAFRMAIRSADIAARYGGEEFAVILPNSSRDEALQVADRIRQAISEVEIVLPEARFRMTASVGVSVLAENKSEPEDLIDRADRALYQAKAMGRNRTEILES